jgi:hypothetical protein
VCFLVLSLYTLEQNLYWHFSPDCDIIGAGWIKNTFVVNIYSFPSNTFPCCNLLCVDSVDTQRNIWLSKTWIISSHRFLSNTLHVVRSNTVKNWACLHFSNGGRKLKGKCIFICCSLFERWMNVKSHCCVLNNKWYRNATSQCW